jgi:hypothetical protein
MQMKNGLSAFAAGINDGSEAIGDTGEFSRLACPYEQPTCKGGIFSIEVVEGGKVLTGNDEQVHRCKLVQRLNNEIFLTFINVGGRGFFCSDEAEDAWFHIHIRLQYLYPDFRQLIHNFEVLLTLSNL